MTIVTMFLFHVQIGLLFVSTKDPNRTPPAVQMKLADKDEFLSYSPLDMSHQSLSQTLLMHKNDKNSRS